MVASFVHRYLDPAESLGEVLFGLIMALTFTLGAGILTQREEMRGLVVAMIGCNVAWGIIDGALYLIGSVFSRNQRIHFARKLRRTTSNIPTEMTHRRTSESSLNFRNTLRWHQLLTHRRAELLMPKPSALWRKAIAGCRKRL